MMNASTLIQRLIALVAVFVFSLVASGCDTTQAVVDIRQHPTQDVTIIHTIQESLTDSGNRFWHCVREGDELICDVVCGVDIQCPERAGLIRARRSATAQLGGPSRVSSEQEPQPEETLSTQRPDEAEESDIETEPETETDTQSETDRPRRRRGEPAESDSESDSDSEGPRRRRGDPAESDSESDSDSEGPRRRRRGNPSDDQRDEDESTESDESEGQQ